MSKVVPNPGDIQLDAVAWYNPSCDMITIRVRQVYTDSEGRKRKRGFIIRSTEEAFFEIAEGMEYPSLPLDDRFTKVAEEV